MNRFVRDHYPAERLPEDLQQLVDPNRPVRIVIEQDEPEQNKKTTDDLFAMIEAYRATIHGEGISRDEAVRRIRDLRDEWDD